MIDPLDVRLATENREAAEKAWTEVRAEFTRRGIALEGEVARLIQAGFEMGFNAGALYGVSKKPGRILRI